MSDDDLLELSEAGEFDDFGDATVAEEDRTGRRRLTPRTVIAASVCAGLVVVAGVSMLVRSSTGDSSGSAPAPVTETTASDYSTITPSAADGVKQDDDGFVPLDNDGGAAEFPELADSSDTAVVEDAVCVAAEVLASHRSRENRSAAFFFIRANADRVEYEPLTDAISALEGFGFDDPGIEEVSGQCR